MISSNGTADKFEKIVEEDGGQNHAGKNGGDIDKNDGDGENDNTRAGELKLLCTAGIEASSSLAADRVLSMANDGSAGDDVDIGEKNLSMVGVLAAR